MDSITVKFEWQPKHPTPTTERFFAGKSRCARVIVSLDDTREMVAEEEISEIELWVNGY